MTDTPQSSSSVSPSDREVVERVLDGDVEAFGILVERYRTELGRIAEAMIGDADAAADALQESFIAAYRGLGGCRDTARFRTWLYQIVRNRCRDALRRRPAVPIETVDVVARESADGPLHDEELGRRLEQALQRLTPEHREAFVLKEVEGRSYQEMTALLDTKIDALRMRVMRARDTLRQALGEAP